MRLPIDTSRLQFLVVSDAEEHRKYDEDKPREQWEPQVMRTASCSTGSRWSR